MDELTEEQRAEQREILEREGSVTPELRNAGRVNVRIVRQDPPVEPEEEKS